MRRLKNVTENSSFGSEPILSINFADESMQDYLNDSHEAFIHKYQYATVEGVNVIAKANDSDLFG